jgi:choline-sulfatase
VKDSPNIVWIYCDELRTDALGCYGNPHVDVKTPNLDGLAERGVLFTNCFCNSPVCVPSRMTKMTGLYPEDTGVYHNEGCWPSYRVEGRFRMFPQIFAENGYRTADFGKLHLARDLDPWQERGHSAHDKPAFFEGIDPEALEMIEIPGPGSMIGGHYPGGRAYPPEEYVVR